VPLDFRAEHVPFSGQEFIGAMRKKRISDKDTNIEPEFDII
jgi:hypothetical protein